MSQVMHFDQVIAAYRQLLEANPGNALMIGQDSVALIADGCVSGAMIGLDGSPDLGNAFDFDRNAFIDDAGHWDCDTVAGLQASINSPVFVALHMEGGDKPES
ncbi:hypothetical protein [Pseudomonas rhodesiae]|jgi:hypothetical protein|uniref:hypothetical protein n=1 Tax=Pseudomonas rhodesiae TaxID=76760 RepID=UPI0020A1E5EE|nr:hypothetical protein [Pseudomonas rhodesiae]MCP1515579.1 hypothetical protein [Pseudomonas rhodesiae]MDF9772982.1 hypothetical protein [Pseudomonas rhodesiae]